MPLTLTCPSCSTAATVPDEFAGKRGKCRNCGSVITAPPIPKQSEQTSVETAGDVRLTPKSKSGGKPGAYHWLITGAAVVLSLVIGYFAGREHLKAQIKATFENAFAEAGANLKKMSNSIEPLTKPAFQAAPPLVPAIAAPAAAKLSVPEPTIVEHGRTFRTDGLEVWIAEAKIEPAEVNTLTGDTKRSASPDLIVKFGIRNTHDRKMLPFKEDNPFMKGSFEVRDDVDNLIRGINFGMSNKPVGAMTAGQDIRPGDEATHVQVFADPPPKTKFLVVSVNLATFGGEGTAKFRIPADKIQGFAR